MLKTALRPENQSAGLENSRVTRAASIVAAATLVSRILGYVRDMVIATLFGAGMASDAFFIAFSIPNLLRRLVGEGSLAVAFVPVFADVLRCKGRSEADQMAASAFRLLFILLLLLSVIGVLLAPVLVHMLAYGFVQVPEKFALCVTLTRIMFPYTLFIGLVALCMGILNVYGHFGAPALAPVMLNAAMISSVMLGAFFVESETVRVTWLAAGVLIGGFMQLALQLPFLGRNRIGFSGPVTFWHPGLKRVMILMGPSLFGAAVYQINSLVIRLLASLLPQGSISYLYYADRLVQFPLGIFAIAMATAVLPTLSRQASDHNWDALRQTFVHAIRFVFFIILPSMIGLIVLRRPIVSLLFQHGAFDEHAVQLTADALLYYGIGLWAVAAVRIVLNVFYALQDTRTPVRIAIVALLANIVLGVLLMKPLQHNGLALALSLASMIYVVLLTWALHRRLGGFRWPLVAVSIGKSLLGAAVMGMVVWVISSWMFRYSHLLGISDLMQLSICLAAGAAVYGGVTYAMKLPELQALLQSLAKRKVDR